MLTGWGLTTLSLFGLTSVMMLDVYLARGNVESSTFDAIKRLLFWGSGTEPVVHAPPLINLSQANTFLAWFSASGIIALGCLFRALKSERAEPSHPRALTVVVSLLTLYCLWGTWPIISRLLKTG